MRIGDKFKTKVIIPFYKEGHKFNENDIINAIWFGPVYVKIELDWRRSIVVPISHFDLNFKE